MTSKRLSAALLLLAAASICFYLATLKSNSLASVVEQDLKLLAAYPQSEKIFRSIKVVESERINPCPDEILTSVRDSFKSNPNSNYKLRVEYIPITETDLSNSQKNERLAVLMQFSVIDITTGNKVYEFSRTYPVFKKK